MNKYHLPQAVRDKLGQKLGVRIQYPSDCERLSRDISNKINETIGVTTLKRLFGFADDVKSPRISTLDIIARYSGYASYDDMLQQLGVKGDSGFDNCTDLTADSLEIGDKVIFSYLPDRRVVIEYMGNDSFRVEESLKGSLKAGDVLTITVFSLHHPLYVQDVKRNGESLGRYVAGKVSGLTSLTVISDGAPL